MEIDGKRQLGFVLRPDGEGVIGDEIDSLSHTIVVLTSQECWGKHHACLHLFGWIQSTRVRGLLGSKGLIMLAVICCRGCWYMNIVRVGSRFRHHS